MKHFVLLTVLAVAASSGTARAGDNVWTSLGPDGGGVRSLVIDRMNPNTVYALTSAGLFKSTDAGSNWGVTSPLPSNSGAITSLVIDPRDSSKLYAANGEASAAGDPRHGRVYKSTDGGVSWRVLDAGSFGLSGPLAVDPEDPRIVYASGYNDIFKSTDGGETWRTPFSGPPGITCCLALAWYAERSQVLLLGLPSLNIAHEHASRASQAHGRSSN